MLNFMKKSYWHRFLVGYIGMFLILLVGFTYLAQPLYYKFMPGSWWINYSASVAPAELGEPVFLVLNRVQRVDIIRFTGVRVVFDDQGNKSEFLVPDPQRGLEFAIAEGLEGDVTVEIPPEKVPQKPSIYRVRTCIEFEVRKEHKSLCYDSNEFTYGAQK